MPKRTTRPPVKKRQIVAELRQRIVSGKLAPGARLDTRSALVDEFGVSGMTVQSAMDQLAGEGFVVAHGRNGTFVSEAPPHLHTFGLVMPVPEATQTTRSRFYGTLQRLVADGIVPPPSRVVVYHGVSESSEHTKDYEHLERDVRERRLAGVVFAGPPWALRASGMLDVLRDAAVPAVALGGPDARTPMPTVYGDSKSLVTRAEEYLKNRGRKRIAWFVIPMPSRHGGDLVTATMRARKRAVAPHLVQLVHPERPWAAQNCARLLMELPDRKRPDAVMICDDNLVRDVTEGLAAAGVRAPRDVEVVAHANFPDRPPAALPVRWLGFDLAQILRTAFDAVRPNGRNGKKPNSVMLRATWESELPDADGEMPGASLRA